MAKILIDLNRLSFQSEMYDLQKEEQRALLNTLKKISKLEWSELYQDKGVNWELISKKYNEEPLYSFRFSQKYRGTAYREGNYMVLVNLFTDHDSAYK